MNIIKRTCATCCAFNPSATEDEPACWNLTSIIDNHGTPQAVHREPGPADCCDVHQTHAEDQAAADAIKAAGHPSALSNLPALDAAL